MRERRKKREGERDKEILVPVAGHVTLLAEFPFVVKERDRGIERKREKEKERKRERKRREIIRRELLHVTCHVTVLPVHELEGDRAALRRGRQREREKEKEKEKKR